VWFKMPQGSVESAGFSQVAAVAGLSGPESVRYDPAQDMYFVSNFSGTLTAKDNNGFISRVRPDGAIDSLKFIAAGRNGVTLHAPVHPQYGRDLGHSGGRMTSGARPGYSSRSRGGHDAMR